MTARPSLTRAARKRKDKFLTLQIPLSLCHAWRTKARDKDFRETLRKNRFEIADMAAQLIAARTVNDHR